MAAAHAKRDPIAKAECLRADGCDLRQGAEVHVAGTSCRHCRRWAAFIDLYAPSSLATLVVQWRAANLWNRTLMVQPGGLILLQSGIHLWYAHARRRRLEAAVATRPPLQSNHGAQRAKRNAARQATAARRRGRGDGSVLAAAVERCPTLQGEQVGQLTRPRTHHASSPLVGWPPHQY